MSGSQIMLVLAAFGAGAGVCLLVVRAQARSSEQHLSATIDTVVAVANERLGAHTEESASDLARRTGLVGQELGSMRSELSKVTALVRELESARATQHGQLTGQIAAASEQTAQLADTTRQLREALSSSKARGQWGERMAEDVLRLAGFVENVNYRKQTALAPEAEQPRAIPDYTFLLPRGLQLHMDVKFPLDNYLRYLEADADAQDAHRSAFLRDVRQRVRELAARDYSRSSDSVDCLLLFLPNEQLYAFVQEHDAPLLDEALRRKIVLCSPLTLFAVLAVVRQSVDSFVVERTSDEILSVLGQFSRQWEKYTAAVDKLGRRLESAQKDLAEITGTRRRALERPLDKLEELRRQRGLPDIDDGDHDDGSGSEVSSHVVTTMRAASGEER